MRKTFTTRVVFNKKNKQLSIDIPKRKINFKAATPPKHIKLKILGIRW